jgi:hypothetical protein
MNSKIQAMIDALVIEYLDAKCGGENKDSCWDRVHDLENENGKYFEQIIDLQAKNERLKKHEEQLESEISLVCPEDFSLKEVFKHKQTLIEELVKLLGSAKCPNACIDGAFNVRVGRFDEESDSEQCQWCFEKNEALAAVKASQKDGVK